MPAGAWWARLEIHAAMTVAMGNAVSITCTGAATTPCFSLLTSVVEPAPSTARGALALSQALWSVPKNSAICGSTSRGATMTVSTRAFATMRIATHRTS